MSRLMQYRSNKYRHSLSSGFVLSSLARSVQISLLGLGLAHCAAHAATIEVTSHLDDDDAGCTLREAIDTIKDADVGLSGCDNSSSDDFGTNDSVTFSNSLATNNTITLNNKPLTFSPFIPGGDPNNFVLTIDATNIAGGITVDANKRSQVLRVFYATLSIKNVTITGGSSSGVGGGLQTSRSIIGLDNATVSGNSASESGGGISATYNSQITAIDSTFSNNSADTDGGGISIDNISSITLTDSIVSDNSVDGDGGGISVKDISSVMLVNSTVSGNSAADDGGGISIIDSTSFLGMNGTTISGNSAAFDGGGAFIFGSFFEATNSTISSNTANDDAGALLATSNSIGRFNNVTVSDNSARARGGGLLVFNGSTMSLSNSVIANSIGGPDCSRSANATVKLDGATIIEDGSCAAIRSGDPELKSLANNGGPTQTHATKATSIARGTGILNGAINDFQNCAINDQRGRLRDNDDAACDVGAFEFNQEIDLYVIPLRDGKSVIFGL